MSSTIGIPVSGPLTPSVSGRSSPTVSSLQGGVIARTVTVSEKNLEKMLPVAASTFAPGTASSNPTTKPTILTNLSDKLEPAFNKIVAILNFIKAFVLGAGSSNFFLETYNAGFKDITEKYNKERKKIQEEFLKEFNKLGFSEINEKGLSDERIRLRAQLTNKDAKPNAESVKAIQYKIDAINKILGNDTGSKETSGDAVIDRGLLGKFEGIEVDERDEIEKLKLRIVETAKLVTGQEFRFEQILKPVSSVSESIPLPKIATFEKIMVDSKLLEKKVETNLILNNEDSGFEAAFTASFEEMGSAGILKYNAQKLDFLETRFKFSGANASEKANIVNALIDEYNKGVDEIAELQRKIEGTKSVAKGVLNRQKQSLTQHTEALGSRINPLLGNESESVRTESSSSQVLPYTRGGSISSSSTNIDFDDDESTKKFTEQSDGPAILHRSESRSSFGSTSTRSSSSSLDEDADALARMVTSGDGGGKGV